MNAEIKTHLTTKADLERGLRLQTGVLLGAMVIAVGLIIAVLGEPTGSPVAIWVAQR